MIRNGTGPTAAKSRNWIFPGFFGPADAAAPASAAGCRPSSPPAPVGLTFRCAAEGEAASPRGGGCDAEGGGTWVEVAEGEAGAAEAATVVAAVAAVAAAFASSAAGRSEWPGLCRPSRPRCCGSEAWTLERPALWASPR